MGATRASFVKRARMSAGAGPYLFGAGVVLGAIGLFLGPLYVPIIIVMALAAPLLQMPRQKAWLTQNDIVKRQRLWDSLQSSGGILTSWADTTSASRKALHREN